MPFLTVDAINGNQAFQNGRCHICFSLDLDRIETGHYLIKNIKQTAVTNILETCIYHGYFFYSKTKTKSLCGHNLLME